MRNLFLAFCLLLTGLVYCEETQSPKNIALVCQGHKMTERVLGRFETAKNSKDKWDERTPYDRSIKECKSEMYREDDRWIIEYHWTHVDDCPKCNNKIKMEVTLDSIEPEIVSENKNASSFETKTALVCQGHGMTERVLGRFETAKNSKDKWDERTPYDRSIKECKSEMYREDDRWIIEYSWTHVDDCPKCNNKIKMEVPK